MNYSIIIECDEWLVVNKPAGESVHVETVFDESGQGSEVSPEKEASLGIVANLKQQLGLEFLAPVHRLDKVTSGCLLLAKSSNAAAMLSKQFANHQVQKYYLAITKGKPKKKQGNIVGDMLPARRGNWKLAKTRSNPAVTQFFSYGFVNGLRVSIVKLITGKTHQIRVALKSNGCPIWGDKRYADSLNAQQTDRCYLHCWQMQFHYEQKIISVDCLPEEGNLFRAESFLEHQILQQSPENLPWPKAQHMTH